MNKKFVIILMFVLVIILFFALKSFKTQEILPEENQKTPVQENIEPENFNEEKNLPIETTFDKFKTEKSFETTKPASINSVSVKKETVKSEDENNFIQEGSVIEEVEEDFGVKKVGENIEVTKEFKSKSPSKYFYKDFGFLENVIR